MDGCLTPFVTQSNVNVEEPTSTFMSSVFTVCSVFTQLLGLEKSGSRELLDGTISDVTAEVMCVVRTLGLCSELIELRAKRRFFNGVTKSKIQKEIQAYNSLLWIGT